MPTKKKGAGEAPTKLQRSYVLANRSVLSEAELVADTGLTAAKVRKIVREAEAAAAESRPSRFDESLHKPARGVVALTPESVSIIDEFRGREGGVTQADIDRAVAAGKYQEAADLQRLRDEGRLDAKAKFRASHADRFHFIRGGRGDDGRVHGG